MVLGFAFWRYAIASNPPLPSRESYTIGPPLPAETPKAPWRPKVASRIAFFFGPVAGAFVSAISLRRMGHPDRAKRVLWVTACALAAVAAILFFIPDALARIVGIGIEGAFCVAFYLVQDKKFREWEATHKDTTPSNGWSALGWGVVGILLFLAIAFAVFMVLAMVFPGRV